jgi:hypothetical protein
MAVRSNACVVANVSPDSDIGTELKTGTMWLSRSHDDDTSGVAAVLLSTVSGDVAAPIHGAMSAFSSM